MKLVFISLNLFYEYYVDFDWCRKVPGRLHACSTLVFGPQVHPPPLRATGLFFPAVGGCWTAGKNSPVAHRGDGGYTRSVFQICCTASYGDPARADKSLLSSAYK